MFLEGDIRIRIGYGYGLISRGSDPDPDPDPGPEVAANKYFSLIDLVVLLDLWVY